ncbi:P-loop containing nucleoside triphosphate hydrolase protein [Protomyces lactucae-debilis]|uniref:p-loop containing nucleoside triphosphate hydrolase protein n=1 Tax=Protomyces lactucae-debilis TaxID=2754530 RepID=A0A1Y2FAF1_PROLT|nr:P-loop containing nucleoside triphosphate hydrolase protein [Protomyces lactucae-debilis]ORY79845.1 P-loop containing nucleoside triphosphate hydrolase protein [Protomyces lactucae-debilis]
MAADDGDALRQVKNIVLVLSGKGGVGKSSVTTQLALSLALAGKRVGILDIDLTGPSIPRMFGVEERQIHQSSGGWVPVYSRSDAVIWRGPKKSAMIAQFLTSVLWGELDYLLIDTPPGTSDEHIAVVEKLRQTPEVWEKCRGAVLVTTPQEVSTADVRKELSFCRKTGVHILGLIENMSGYICPCCDEVTNIFSSGGGEAMAIHYNVPFMGKIPIEPRFGEMVEQGQSGGDTLLDRYRGSALSGLFAGIAKELDERIHTA